MAGLGRKVFSPGEVLTATNVQNYLMDQAVQVYAGTAARGSAIGSATTEGMVSWLQDTDQLQVATGTATWADVSFAQSPNAVINGAFDVWQRGTSFTSPAFSAYTADRWTAGVPAVSTISRQTTGLTGFRFCIRVQRNSGQTTTAAFNIGQPFEIAEASLYAGKTVTFSFYARAGSNYSSTGQSLGLQLYTGTGATEVNRMNAAYTGDALAINTAVTLTTSWQRFSLIGALNSSVTQFMPAFQFAGSGTAGANDYFEITGVQIEVGSVATPFCRNQENIQAELAACQRYYYRAVAGAAYGAFGLSFAASGTSVQVQTQYPVSMRTAPTAIETLATSNYAVADGVSRLACSGSFGLDGSQTTNERAIFTISSSGLTTYRPYAFTANNNVAAYLGFSAEL
jgi:hypothetical protein